MLDTAIPSVYKQATPDGDQTMHQASKSEFFKFAHMITRGRYGRNKAYFGSYQKAFGAILKELYAQNYHRGMVIDDYTNKSLSTDGRIA